MGGRSALRSETCAARRWGSAWAMRPGQITCIHIIVAPAVFRCSDSERPCILYKRLAITIPPSTTLGSSF